VNAFFLTCKSNLSGGINRTTLNLEYQQNNITAQPVQNQALASLPPRAIPELDDNPPKYAAFIRAFEEIYR
jgi:hypothetical protein